MTTADFMKATAEALDKAFNGDAKGSDRKIGFALLVYEFGTPKNGQVNYVGNGERADVKAALKELLARWEGRYTETTSGSPT